MTTGETAALQLPGWTHVYSGKVRDLYEPSEPGGEDVVLVVASDRISAFDFVLDSVIPDKGKILTALSLWWFEELAEIVPNHLYSTNVPDAVRGRAMICRRLRMFPIECVARGYLTGSGFAEYRKARCVCGVDLPGGLNDGSRLPEPIYTPAAKAELGEHDENISFQDTVGMVGKDNAARLRDVTLTIYRHAQEIAGRQGIILADTKCEFGIVPGSRSIVLGDEVLTPDSSRFWDASSWEPGRAQASFDKQYVRDWLLHDSGWGRSSGERPPGLPSDVIERTRLRYLEAYRRLTGRDLML